MNIATGDVLPAVDADAGAAPRGSANIRHLSRMELPGGGQIVIQGTTAFVGHQVGPEGTTILDISDPRKPKVLSQIMCSHPWSHSHKARVVGDIMVVNSEREPGKGKHPRISRRRLPHLRRQGQDQSEAHHLPQDARQGRAPLRSRRELRLHLDRDGGLCRQHPGDLRHPQSVEAGRSRALVHGEPARRERRHAAPEGHRASPASRHAQRQPDVRGLLDVGRRHHRRERHHKPKTLSRYQYNPPHPEPTHTFLGVPHAIGGKRIAVSTEEERANRGPDTGKPHGPFRTWDVTDPTKPKLLCYL